jgi:hypothetical protein
MAERFKARLKDEFGTRFLRVRTHSRSVGVSVAPQEIV